MERLKSAVPAELRQAIGEGTAGDLPSTTSRLLAFFHQLPLFHQVIGELTDPELALCRKDKGKALDLKGRGNACFSRREFDQALGFYSQALRYAPIGSDGIDLKLVATLYVNRASTMHKLGLLEECLRDCDRAIVVSPNYAKAWYRRGMVNASLKNYSSSVHDLEIALSMEGTSSGKSNIEQELKLVLEKPDNANGAGTTENDGKGVELPNTDELHKVVLQCISTPDKGRGMASPSDIPPASLLHTEDPLAAIVMKPCRETHCHYCFTEVPADVLFCSSCTIPIYCSKRCQEKAVGEIFWNQDVCPELNNLSVDLAKYVMGVTCANRSEDPNSKHIAEHRHECGGAHWAAVLPPDIVLTGRIMAQYIERRMLAGKSSVISLPNLDLVHHYDQHPPPSKLELHIYAIVLFLCLQNYYGDLLCTEDSLSQLVLLICQIKVNSIAIVHIKSRDGGEKLKVDKKLYAASGAITCSIEQVRVGQAIYPAGSFFNHSCQPNIHAYFLSRTLFLRSTEFIPSWNPLELSYGPQVGEMDLQERQKSLEENYYFNCQCSSCSELNLSDLVISSFRCPRHKCLGAVLESTYYRSEENFVHVSRGESRICKLSLPEFSKVDEDMAKVARSFFENHDIIANIDPGCCMSCRSRVDLSSAVATSDSAISRINGFKDLVVVDKVPDVLIPEALESLEPIKLVRHPYSKAIAQVEDWIAEAFVKIGDPEQAIKHCQASMKILEKLYHPKHIVIGHELIKLVTVQLSLGDRTSAMSTLQQAEAIFSLYYGSHVMKVFPYVDILKELAMNFASSNQAI